MATKRRLFDDELQLREEEIDRLSDLPEPLLLHIISFLPTRFAARTSLLSRRFRHLWTASPSIDLDRSTFPPGGRLFVTTVNRCLRRRDLSAPLLTLRLKTDYSHPFPIKSLTKWLVTANSLGLRHLYLDVHQEKIMGTLLPLILSFHSLESLFIDKIEEQLRYRTEYLPIIPPKFNAINLKNLHVNGKIGLSELTRLITEQTKLEYLSYNVVIHTKINLSSRTVKILKFTAYWSYHLSEVNLSFPNLEILDLNIPLLHSLIFHGDMPSLKKASFKTHSLPEEFVPFFDDLLRIFVNVEELDICIERLWPKKEHWYSIPFHPLLEPGKEFPIFPNLKKLKISLCFHELSIEDVVCLLRNSPVLECARLVHVTCEERYFQSYKSKLPLNSEGNNEHAYFEGLRIGDNKIELIKKLSKK